MDESGGMRAALRLWHSGGIDAVVAHVERLHEAILDIDAHATPLAEDDDGFVTGGYLISVGCLHRALGVIGHTAPPCKICEAGTHDCASTEPATTEEARPHGNDA